MSSQLYARVSARIGALQLDVEVEADKGPLMLIGPNGAGKTSLVSLLLGALSPARARVVIGEAVLVDTDQGIALPIGERRLGYVPQDYALFPHMTVRENVAFAVRCAGLRGVSVDSVLGEFGVAALAERRPATLSGGEKQRVALARALSLQPRALLLDEPLAALDVHARREVRQLLAATLHRLALPTLIITHDPMDARALAARIAVLEAGKITQLGSWAELKARPATHFVAEFVRSLEDDAGATGDSP
jgi:molybdate transport system ATP-binding protein